jgi:ubiquinone/menaquinone biosynthesis C-methylase UbiE
MTGAVREWWEATATYFQDEANVDVGLHWGSLGPDVDDETMIGRVEGADVVELGCGGGQVTVALASRGATVTGIDLSTEQLAHAKALADDHGVRDATEFAHGDVTDLPFPDASFDLACNAFVYQWVDDIEASFRGSFRVLRPGGRFAFSTPHPYYRLLAPETGTLEESYFDTGRHVRESEDGLPPLVTYRSTVSDFHNALQDAGFDIE